eukprot:10060259-Lingulodinium_polyedra.AAC.1
MAAAPAASGGRAEYCPHIGFVHVEQDTHSGQWWLVHTATLERIKLEGGPDTVWDIAFSEEGLGIVQSTDMDEPIEVESLLQVDMFEAMGSDRKLMVWKEKDPECERK